MKIFYLSQSVVPSKSANSIHVMNICSAFANLKHEVNLFTYDIESEKIKSKNIFKFYGVKDNFRVKQIYTFKNIFIREFFFLFNVLVMYFKEKPDMIYSRSIQMSFFLSLCGIKTFLEIHSPPSFRTDFIFRKFLNLNNFYKIIVISKNLKNFILKKYKIKNEKKIEILSDSASYNHNYKYDKINRKIFLKKNSVGYLGHLYQGRGIDLIIKIAKKLPENNFYIVGGFEKTIEYWKSKTQSNNVFFLGFLPYSSCEILRKRFDYLIAPYQQKVYVYGSKFRSSEQLETSQWMSPLKIFEYMAASKPIIASNLENIREVLNHKNSILCKTNDSSQWIKAIKKLNLNKKFRKNISQQAYKDFIKKYTWNERVNRIVNFHKKSKKILIFNYSLVGAGTEYVLLKYANNLTSKYDVHIALCQKEGVYTGSLNDNIKKYFFNTPRVSSSIFMLKNLIKNKNIDYIFTSMIHTNILAILIKVFFRWNLKVIIRESNTISFKHKFNFNIKDFYLIILAKIFYKFANKVISSTNVISKDLINNFNVNKNKILKLENPCEIEEIKNLSNTKYNFHLKKLLKKKFILSIGRLTFQKNFNLLLESFSSFIKENKKFKKYKLYILGEGKDKKFLIKKIKALKLQNEVSLLGFQKNPFIFMKYCKLFMLTSRYEGHSNVLVHSQIMSNKILASSAFGSNKEVVQNNGNIFKSNNPKIISKSIRKVLISKKKKINQKKLFKKYNALDVVNRFSNRVIDSI
jgi:glycosyltransferase involved in cell wall biosynthesis